MATLPRVDIGALFDGAATPAPTRGISAPGKVSIGDLFKDAQSAKAEVRQSSTRTIFDEDEEQPVERPKRGLTGVLSDLGSAAFQGTKSTGRSLGAAGNTITGDLADVERYGEAQRAAASQGPEAKRALLSEIERRKQADPNPSVVSAIRNVGSAMLENPEGAAQFVVEQAPNAAVSLGAGFAGAKAGMVFGPIGGVAGFLGGMFLGNFMLETGGNAIEKSAGGFTPDERGEALREGAIKGGVVTAVDAATLGAGGKLAKTLNKAAIEAGAKAEAKVLADAGVDLASRASIEKALANPTLRASAKEAGRTAAKQASTVGSKAAAAGTGIALETVGEGTGEYLGELAATGEADVYGAVLEAAAGLTQSIPETAYNISQASGNNLDARGIQRAQLDPAKPPAPPGKTQQTQQTQGLPLTDDRLGSDERPPMSWLEVNETLQANPGVLAVLSADAKTPEEKEMVQRAIARSEIGDRVEAILNDPQQLNDARTEMQSELYQPFVSDLLASLPMYANEMPPGGTFKVPSPELQRQQQLDEMTQSPEYLAQLQEEADRFKAEREARQMSLRKPPAPDAPVTDAPAGIGGDSAPAGLPATAQASTTAEQSQTSNQRMALLEAHFSDEFSKIRGKTGVTAQKRAANLRAQMARQGMSEEDIQRIEAGDTPPDMTAPLFSKSPNGRIKAAFFKDLKKVYYSAFTWKGGLSSQQRRALELHEVGAHYAVERMLGSDGYSRLLSDLRAMRGKDKTIDAAYASVPTDTPADQVDHEALGYLIENYENNSFVRRFIQMVADWYKKTFKGQTLTASDLRALVRSAYNTYGKEIKRVYLRENISDVPAPNAVRLDFQQAINSSPEAHRFLDFISQFRDDVTLSGSLAISAQAAIYRPQNQQIHDLDFRVADKDRLPAILEAVAKAYPNSGIYNKFASRKTNSDVVTITLDKDNKDALTVDFFTKLDQRSDFITDDAIEKPYTGADGKERTLRLNTSDDIFGKKLAMNRAKDVSDSLMSGNAGAALSREQPAPKITKGDEVAYAKVVEMIQSGNFLAASRLHKNQGLFAKGFGSFDEIRSLAQRTATPPAPNAAESYSFLRPEDGDAERYEITSSEIPSLKAGQQYTREQMNYLRAEFGDEFKAKPLPSRAATQAEETEAPRTQERKRYGDGVRLNKDGQMTMVTNPNAVQVAKTEGADESVDEMGVTYELIPESKDSKKELDPKTKARNSYIRQAFQDAQRILRGTVIGYQASGNKRIPIRLDEQELRDLKLSALFRMRPVNAKERAALEQVQARLNASLEAIDRQFAEQAAADRPDLSVREETAPDYMGLPKTFEESGGTRLSPVGSAENPEQRELDAPNKFESRPGQQFSLGLGRLLPEKYQGGQRKLFDTLEGLVRSFTRPKYFEDTILLLNKQLNDIDQQLKDIRTITVDGQTFRAKDEADERPGLWGTYDENAYDRFEKGFRPDKPTTKDELLAARRAITRELERVRDKSNEAKAKLFMRARARLLHDIFDAVDKATLSMKREKALEVANPFLRSLMFDRSANTQGEMLAAQSERINSERELAEAAFDIPEQADSFEGARVAMGFVSDFAAKRLTAREMESVMQRGLREGDFTFDDLRNAFRAYKLDIPRGVMDISQQLAVRKSMAQHMKENGNSTASRMEWLASMDQVLQVSPGAAQRFTESERAMHGKMFGLRNVIKTRREKTDEMVAATNAEDAFPALLFNNYTLAQASNDKELSRWLEGNGYTAWMQDVAYALRSRPDLAGDIFRIVGDDKPAFDRWIQQMKDAIALEAKVAAKVPGFLELRNLDIVRQIAMTDESFTPEERRRIAAGEIGPSALINSQPMRDEFVNDMSSVEDVSPQTLMDEAVQALERFAVNQGIRVSDIRRVSGGRVGNSARGVTSYTFTLKSGRRLVGETLDLFPEIESELSRSEERGIAIPEVMNAALRNDIGAVYELVQSGDRRAQGRGTPKAVPVEPAAGSPDTRPNRYEELLVSLANAEMQEIPGVLDTIAQIKSIVVGQINADTGEFYKNEQEAIDAAASYIDSIRENALRGSVYNERGTELRQFAANQGFSEDAPAGLRRGEFGFGETAEDAAEAMRVGANDLNTDISTEEALQDELLSETQFMEIGGERLPEDEQGVEGVAADRAATEREDSQSARVTGSLVGGPEYRFRKGFFNGNLVPAVVTEHLSKIAAKWSGAPNMVIVPNVQSLPAELREKVMAKLGNKMYAKGLYFNGDVYIFTDHAESLADAEFTLFHEVEGHFGMRAFMGADFDAYLERLYKTNPDIRRAADARMNEEPMGRLEAVDEVLSDMQMAGQNSGMFQAYVGKLIAGLRKIGMERVANWIASQGNFEVAYLLRGAKQAVRRGDRPSVGAPDDLRLAAARTPYELFSSRDGKTVAYARYNPVLDRWSIFTATGPDIRNGFNTAIEGDFEKVVATMRKLGKVERRMRSGVYVDNKIPSDLAKIPDFRVLSEDINFTSREGLRNAWSMVKRNAAMWYQNEYLPVFEVVNYLEAKGRMNDAYDPRPDLEGMYERRASEKLKDYRQQYEKPLMKLAGKFGREGGNRSLAEAFPSLAAKLKDSRLGDISILDAYLGARHAAERNAAIARINPNQPDGGSGIFTSDADLILNTLSREPYANTLAEMTNILQQMSQVKLEEMYASGMIDTKELEARSQYKYYVNLSGINDKIDQFDNPAILAGGPKFGTRKDRRAMGRGDAASDILIRTLQSFDSAVIHAEKNKVKQKVLAMFEINYDPDFVVINKQATKRTLERVAAENAAFGEERLEVVEGIDPNYIKNQQVMIVHVKGKPVTMEFKQKGPGSISEALNGLVYPPQTTNLFLRAARAGNQYIGRLLTTLNPVWGVINYARDVQHLMSTMTVDPRFTPQMRNQVFRMLKDARRAAYHVATEGRYSKDAKQDLIDAFQEMRREGGATSFLNLRGLEQQVKELEDVLKGFEKPETLKEAGGRLVRRPISAKAWMNLVEKVGDVAEAFTLPMEMAPRIATYKVLVDNGFTKQEAARIAGDITVNFNMRGSSQAMRSLFLFFNPAVQGTEKMYRLYKSNPKGMAKVATGFIVLGMLANMIARELGGEDEEGEDKLDGISAAKRSTFMVLWPGMPFGAIPIPYGWNAAYSFGNFLLDGVTGKQSWETVTKRIASSTFEAFAPLGGALGDASSLPLGIAKMFTPTVVGPMADLFIYKENRFGAPIEKQQGMFGGARIADSYMNFDSASPISTAAMRGLNKLTGGDRVNPGLLDFNSSGFDYMVQGYLPGLPTEVYRAISLGIKKAQGYETKDMPIPFVDRLTAKPNEESINFERFRRVEEFVKTKIMDFKMNPENQEKILEQYPGIGGAEAIINSANYRLNTLRQQRNALNTPQADRLTEEEKVDFYNRERAEERRIMSMAIKRILENAPELRPIIAAKN